ncbi:hypothetical protein ACFW04_012378 [Cataglyphis niger]
MSSDILCERQINISFYAIHYICLTQMLTIAMIMYNTLVFDNKVFLNTSCIQEILPKGRRIVDISFMWNEVHRTFNNHARGLKCQFKEWKLVNSRRRGLMTQLFFKCRMRNYEANIWSESTEPKILDINTAAVAGTVTTGIDFAQLEELCASMNVPSISEPTYIKYRENLVDDFQKTAMRNEIGWRS